MAKPASVAIYGGSGTAIFAGLSASEWQIAGVVGGILIGLAGMAVNAYFKYLHYQLAKRRAGVGEDDE